MQVVLRAFGGTGLPLPRALGLDITERAKFEPRHLEALIARGGGPDNAVMRFVADALRFYMEFHSKYDGFYGAHIHDALAVAAALDPSLVRYEALPVDVELAGTLTTGETVTDWRRRWGKPPNLEVAVDADIPRFFDRFIERVGSLAASRPGVAP